MRYFVRLLINAAALWIATMIVPGIRTTGGWASLLIVALLFGALNATLRPLLKLLTCPLLVLTLGLFTLVINAVMLWLTGRLSEPLGLGFHVQGFVAAFLGALVVSAVAILLSLIFEKPADD